MKNQTRSRSFSARYDLYQLICVLLATVGGMSQVMSIILAGYIPTQYRDTCEYVGHGLAILCFAIQLALMRWMRSDKVAVGVVMDKMSRSLSAVGTIGEHNVIGKQASKLNDSGYLSLLTMAQKHFEEMEHHEPKAEDTDSLLGDHNIESLVKLNDKNVLMMDGSGKTISLQLMNEFLRAVFTAEFKSDDATFIVKEDTVLPMSLLNQPLVGATVEKYNPFYIYVSWGVRADGTWYVVKGTAIPMPSFVKEWALKRVAAGRPHFAFKDAPWINEPVSVIFPPKPQNIPDVLVPSSVYRLYPNIHSDEPVVPDSPPPYPVAASPV